MGWTIHELRFRVLSELHVGYQKMGNVQRTRWYVPARLLWAALTARLTRGVQYGQWTPPSDVAPGDYEVMGTLVHQQIVFSYYYPTDANGQPLYPHYELEGLRFGSDNMTPDTFAWRYLGGYASTALNYTRSAAEQGTLHEVEFIAPHTRPDGDVASYPVFLSGYVLIADDCTLPWEQALIEIQLGGERGYGWGRLRLESRSAVMPDSRPDNLFGQWTWRVGCAGRPSVLVSPEQPLLAHTRVNGIHATGDVEPLVSRAWDRQRGAGQRVESSGVCYAPGSRLNGDRVREFEWTTAQIWQSV